MFLPKMVAGLLSHPKRQFLDSENVKHSFYFYYENFRWNFTNENASWTVPSTEQIFTETSRLVPLNIELIEERKCFVEFKFIACC